eukprot:362139-Rhodomonas_salina.2
MPQRLPTKKLTRSSVTTPTSSSLEASRWTPADRLSSLPRLLQILEMGMQRGTRQAFRQRNGGLKCSGRNGDEFRWTKGIPVSFNP